MNFHTDVITLYNYDFDNDTMVELWKPTVFGADHPVRLIRTQGSNISTSGLADADAAKVYIRYSDLPKTYAEPADWNVLSEAEKTEKFTFSSERDFFVVGDTSSETILTDGFYEYMKNKYDGVYAITTVDRYEHIMPHFEVGGK